MEFDCSVLKRPTAYCRNALKNTEQIEAIKTQLQKVNIQYEGGGHCGSVWYLKQTLALTSQDLRKLEGKQFENELDRELAYLSVHRAALEAVIPLTGPYAPQLTKAKVVHTLHTNRHGGHVVSDLPTGVGKG